MPSPYRPVSALNDRKAEDLKQELGEQQQPAKPDPDTILFPPLSGSDGKPGEEGGTRRPRLPAKEYEVEEEEEKLASAYDYRLLNAWLSHPVKRYKGSQPSLVNVPPCCVRVCKGGYQKGVPGGRRVVSPY